MKEITITFQPEDSADVPRDGYRACLQVDGRLVEAAGTTSAEAIGRMFLEHSAHLGAPSPKPASSDRTQGGLPLLPPTRRDMRSLGELILKYPDVFKVTLVT